MSLPFVDYIPAQLHESKIWYIDYYVKQPTSKKLIRKAIKVNRIQSITERRKFAKKLVLELNKKLELGWTPFQENDSPKAFTKLFDVFDIFIRNKQKELRPRTVEIYTSFINMLKSYLTNKKLQDIYIINFDRVKTHEFMDYIYNERKISSRSFNNYRDFFITFFNFAIENLYCSKNYFIEIKLKKENKKQRQIIDKETRTKIKDYLIFNNRVEFYTICLITFHTFIRPKEIVQLKPSNFDLKNKTIILNPEITKDNDYRFITLTSELVKYLEMIGIDKLDENFYVFGQNFKPNKKPINPERITYFWDVIRTAIKFKKEFQFYSLKDTGIVEMLKSGVSPDIVRDQAGHYSLEVTNRYVQIARQKAEVEIIEKMHNF